MSWWKSYQLCILILLVFVVMPFGAAGQTIDDLRQDLENKRQSLQEAEEKIKQFKSTIQEKKQKARTLSDQITIIDDSVAELELGIARTEAEVEQTDAEIAAIGEEIAIKEQEITRQKALLAVLLREHYELEQQSSVAVFLEYRSFAEAVSEVSTMQELEQRSQETMNKVKDLRDELVGKQQDLEDFKQTLETLRERLRGQQQALDDQRQSKARILELTRAQEAQYQDLLTEAQQAHQDAEAAINSLDAQIREELRKRGVNDLPSVGTLSWPINPIYGVSCEFRCAGYPYEYLIGPHSAMDIPANLGTPITAPADGYVARVNIGGVGQYSYVMLVHGDDISTVYGHISGAAVEEGALVSRGTVVAYSGGAPGAPGAGLSTGPHVHFEVREDGTPVNPRTYLSAS